MTQQNRTTLKNYFRTGKRPTQDQFADLIDSSINLAESDLVEADGNFGLGYDQPLSRLSVNGNLSVSPNNDGAPDNGLFVQGRVGIGAGFSNPTAQLAVNGSVYIGASGTTDPGPNGLRIDGDITSGGNLTLATEKHITTDMVRARDNSGLKLLNPTGKGLKIHAGTGHVDSDGDLKLGDNRSLFTDRVAPRDTSGIRFNKTDGSIAMQLHNSGKLSIGTVTSTWAKVNISGSLVASSILQAKTIKLTGNVMDTEFYGSKGGKKYGNWIVEAPDGKVVTGLKFERWRSGDGDKDMYRIALRYR